MLLMFQLVHLDVIKALKKSEVHYEFGEHPMRSPINEKPFIYLLWCKHLLKRDVLSVPKFTANLYCILICGILKQMQYMFAVNFETLNTYFLSQM